jgi:ABC-type thiamin/hydroxymethylpyrimidine transport system permease subunit
MRRFFFTFADGPPDFGLLLLRLIVATTLIARCLQLHNSSPETIAATIVAAAAGSLLLFGSWTLVAGVIVTIAELFIAFSYNHDPWPSVLLASLGVVMALLGPGVWSVDARRFGWKRIEIRRGNE